MFMCSDRQRREAAELGRTAEFVHPETGSPARPVIIHLTKGASEPDAAYAYMDAAISKAAQEPLKMPPTEMFPTNREVAFYAGHRGNMSRASSSRALVYPDWALINKNRADWTGAFDRSYRSEAGEKNSADERARLRFACRCSAVGGVLSTPLAASDRIQLSGRRRAVAGQLRGLPRRPVQLSACWSARCGSAFKRDRAGHACSACRSLCSTGTAGPRMRQRHHLSDADADADRAMWSAPLPGSSSWAARADQPDACWRSGLTDRRSA